ncbi:hypothetical protein CHU98_g11190 [Xylaria longipes]|nr:hypothetical protein CHU98_g11190 [Xylaria longipes]
MSSDIRLTQLFGRQIRRFCQTSHPNTHLIQPQDLDFALLVTSPPAPTLEESDNIIPYPLEWVESKSKLRTFLRSWRKRQPQTQIEQSEPKPGERADPDPAQPETPRHLHLHLDFSPPSVGQGPSSSLNTRFLDEPEDTEDSDSANLTIRRLSEFTFDSPESNSPEFNSPKSDSPAPDTPENPRSQTMSQPQNQPLSAQDAANLIAAAFERHKTDITEVVARTLNQIQRDSPGPAGNGHSLKAEEVGFFNPSTKDNDGSGAVAHGKQTIYTDVWAFTDRLSHLAVTHGEEKVKTVWTTCLQATALAWHTTELTDLEKTALRGGTVQLICETLQKRFKKNHSDALQSLQQSRFTMYDLQQGKALRPFIQSVIRDGKACGYTLKNQLLAAFESLDSDIQSQLTKPADNTTLGTFLTEVDDRESILIGKARQLPQLPHQMPMLPVSAYYGKQNFPRFPYSQTRFSGLPQAREGQARAQTPDPYGHPANQRYYQNRQMYDNFRPRGRELSTSEFTMAKEFPEYQYAADHGSATEFPDEWSPPYEEAQAQEFHEGYQQPIDPHTDSDHILSCGPLPNDFGPPDMTDQDAPEEATNFGTVISPPARTCQICHKSFASNNQLHNHVRSEHQVVEQAQIAVEEAPVQRAANVLQMLDRGKVVSTPNPQLTGKSHIPIVKSIVDSRPDIGTGFTYKSKTYLKLFLMTSPDSEHQEDICGDTGCTRTLADKAWALANYPNLEIRRRAVPMVIRGIANDEHSTSEYAIINFFFKGVQNGKPTVASFTREITLVNGLQAKMLLGVDILDAEQIDIILSRKVAVIQSCKVAIPVSVTPGNSGKTKDYIFEPTTDQISCFAAIANDSLTHIPVRNDTDKDIYMHKNTELGFLSPLEPDCRGYQITHRTDESIDLATRQPPTKHDTHTAQDPSNRILSSLRSSTTGSENTIKHPCGVTIYKHPQPEITQALYNLITEFEDVFHDTGFAIVPEEEQPIFHLKPGWEKEIPKKCRAYPVNAEDQHIIRDTIAGLETKSRVFRTRQPVPLSFPVSVIWRRVPDPKDPGKVIRKGRMVVDVRTFNKMNLPDAYPMKSQDDMLRKMANKEFLTLFDAISFYYQWLTHPSTRWALTITTLEGQYTFNCLVMGYKNSNAYVQRQMDTMLQPVKSADCYCDDICVASKEFQEHYRDLYEVLSILRARNISIGPSKTFVGFPDVVVLGRLVDSFGLSTTKERLDALAKLTFPTTLKDLETFLGLTGYMRSNVPRYAEIAEPLERRKTAMLRANPRKKSGSKAQRKRWAFGVPIDTPTEAERLAFEDLRRALTQHTLLHFFSPEHKLCIDFDVSCKGIGVSVYHIAEESLAKITSPDGTLTTFPPRTAIQPIAFLSRLLAHAEKRYWPTEMEVLGFVWALRKTRHWIDVAQAGVYIFTDHRAIIGLTNHKDIVNSTALSSKNLRLIRAMEYISRFTFSIMHKPGKLHIIPDALSRLPTASEPEPERESDLEFLPDDAEEQWSDPKEVAFAAEVLPAMRLAWTYGLAADSPPSKGVVLIQISPEFKGIDRFTQDFVLDRKELQRYLKSCPECSVLRNRTHKPYGSLQPILSPLCLFHTITIDIALALPQSSPNNNNAFMAVVCKFTKAVQIIPGRHDWSAADWANALLDRLLLVNWGIPKAMLSDRDPKFLAELWQQIWKRLGTRLLYATAYHPSTDGQTERFILTIKSTLRYYFHSLDDPSEWENCLPRLQFELNNSRASATGQTPSETMLGFTPNFILEMFDNQAKPRSRIEVSDAIALSSMTAKNYYDQRHQPIFFEVGQRVLLRLHKGYNIPKAAILGRKLGQQSPGTSSSHYFGRFFPHPGEVHMEAHTRRIINHDKQRYLVEYIGLGPEYHKWATMAELGEKEEAGELIADYRRRRPATIEAQELLRKSRRDKQVDKAAHEPEADSCAEVLVTTRLPLRPVEPDKTPSQAGNRQWAKLEPQLARRNNINANAAHPAPPPKVNRLGEPFVLS